MYVFPEYVERINTHADTLTASYTSKRDIYDIVNHIMSDIIKTVALTANDVAAINDELVDAAHGLWNESR